MRILSAQANVAADPAMNPAAAQTRILVAEDNPDDVFFLRRILKKAGLADLADFVGDGEEAIVHLTTRLDQPHALPHLVLLDLNMPRVNGLEVIQWVRKRPEMDNVTLVVVTSSPDEKDVERARAAGCDAYLVKYPPPERLREIADAALRSRQGS